MNQTDKRSIGGVCIILSLAMLIIAIALGLLNDRVTRLERVLPAATQPGGAR